jgi:5-methyltetrahydrofolate--homocysteine methyltransferase
MSISEASPERPVIDLSGPVPARRTEAELRDFLAERILVLDGATGTGIQDRNLTAEDFGGPDLEGCNENLVRTRPDVVADLHASYLAVGADMVETDSFGGTPLVLAEYGLAEHARELNRLAAEIAKKVAAAYSTPERPRFVAGSIGPTTKAITVTGGVTFPDLTGHFREQAIGLIEGGADVLLIETQQDTRNVKAALIGVAEARALTGVDVPAMVSCTIEPTGTMLAGQGVEAFWASVCHQPLLSVGLNCATGPEFMTDHLRSLSALATTHVSCVPNAGLPDEDGNYAEGPAAMAAALRRFLEEGWVNVIGGCCGTRPEHVRAFAEIVQGARPRRPPAVSRTIVSGIDFLEADEDVRPVLVGERTNVIGSRKFKKLVCDEKYEEAAEIARRQVKGGAQVIDINLQNPDRDELKDVAAFYERVIRMVKVPLMLDSTDADSIELALTYCQGKSIINSINLEDGEERFEKVCPLVRKFGGAVVVGTIDEDPVQGMGVTRERKLEIARRSYGLLTGKYGLAPEDIIWDPLVFPVGTGDKAYLGSAEETIEAIRLLKKEFPRTKTILGVSNVSFGLPTAGREVLNSVYLYLATKAGLDFAIVNTEKLERYNRIPDAERKLAEDLLFNRGPDPVARFAAHFRQARSRVQEDDGKPRTLDERLAGYIVEGTKDGLVEDLERKRAEGTPPLEIINGPLMGGMAEVGRLFNDNQLIVAEVLQSAEAMKAAVSHLEQYMEKADTAAKGKVVLATVKGDVHDIGKNLVDIVLSNNGYEVVNLGIKIAPEVLIEACREHKPDILGLSGLLVKSALQMVITAEDLSRAETVPPLLVGGAALSENFTLTRIAPAYEGAVFYAKDAMAGLALCDRIRGANGGLEVLTAETRVKGESAVAKRRAAAAVAAAGTARSSQLAVVEAPLPPPDLERHVEMRADLKRVWPWINPQALFGRHLGLRGRWEELWEKRDEKAMELSRVVKALQSEAAAGAMTARAVWQWFRAESDGNVLRILTPGGLPLEQFTFLRQPKDDGLCIADWVNPAGAPPDHVGLFVTTAGDGVRDWFSRLKAAGEYLNSHAVQALALETAEAYAELVHADMRAAWGFPDPPGTTMADRFRSRYRGIRVSFGYPACPALEDQRKLWKLLRPEEIGVQLTDGDMMDPEASVSALVFQHPDAAYFAVGPQG